MSRSLAKWDRRIERANELAATHSFAAEALRFYARIASFQKSLYTGLEAGSSPPGSLRDGLELTILLPWFAPFLSLIEGIAPPPLAQSAAESARREARLPPRGCFSPRYLKIGGRWRKHERWAVAGELARS
jgi:hypothetical protein